MMNNNYQEHDFSMESLLLRHNKPFQFSSKDTHMLILINFKSNTHVNMNGTFQVIELLRSCLVSLILTTFALTKWLTQIFLDCNRFNKGEITEVCIEQTLKEYSNKRRTDKTRTIVTEIALITLANIHTNMTKHQNKV